MKGIIMKKSYIDYALLMKALADETRIKIFDMLSQGELCACNILDEFNITQPTLSYHMKILCDCGLVESRKDGVWMKYTINKNALDSLKEFFDHIDYNMKNQIICNNNC
jgi:ArsR family transcriptional regulator, arsenate/arsenite/antimonite-responsive transcriptional repressor